MTLRTIQLGMNTADLAGSIRLYAEAFGFVNAGSQVLWGDLIQIQGLTPDSRAVLWWLIGRQPFMQLELYHHTRPAQRPLRSDWRPCDHGWVRFGIAVPEFDRCLAKLAAHGVRPLAAPVTTKGLRRVAFRDPYVGVVVEVLEDGAALADLELGRGDGPAVVYATSSVSSIAAARSYYGDTLGFRLSPLERLHVAEHETLWGLTGATREGFVVESGPTKLEIVEYRNPAGRPRPADYRSSDQGIVNAAIGSRDVAPVARAYERLAAIGVKPPYPVEGPGVKGGTSSSPTASSRSSRCRSRWTR